MTRLSKSDAQLVPIASITHLYETDNGIVIEVRFKSKAAMEKAEGIERAISRMLMGMWPTWEDDE